MVETLKNLSEYMNKKKNAMFLGGCGRNECGWERKGKDVRTGRDCLIVKLRKFTFLTPSLLSGINLPSRRRGDVGRVTQGSLMGKENKGGVYLRVLEPLREGNPIRVPRSKMAALSDGQLWVWALLPALWTIPWICCPRCSFWVEQ